MFTQDLFNKGIALANLHNFVEALACFNEILRFNPDDADVLYNKGVALAALQEYEEAIFYYGQSLKINPYNAEIPRTQMFCIIKEQLLQILAGLQRRLHATIRSS